MADGSVQVLRSADRFRTQREAVSTTHGFSFGDHYDPARISFGVLVAHNVETLQPGGGYPPHHHRDVEIVSWVISGALEHSDDHRHSARLTAGAVQRLTTVAGVTHSEVSAVGAAGAVTQFVQLWLRCSADDLPAGEAPSYEWGAVEPEALRQQWLALASDDRDASAVVSLRTRGVSLWAIELAAGQSCQLPSGSLVHLYVVSGAIGMDTGKILHADDSAMLRDAGSIGVQALEECQILALTMPA